jgi:tetratricopeptide (TPR) repeat protein
MPSLGLSMIVKNAAETIRPCLESVRGIVDQIVVADTGCTDNTCDIAREFGATIVAAPWQNHFAEARNAALQPLPTDWVLVLDADEELDRDAKKHLPELLSAAGVGGYVTPIRNYVPCMFGRAWNRTTVPNDGRHQRAKDAPAYFTNENCRLFQRRPDIYFTGRVHELVEYQIKVLGLKLQPANFFIHHFGHLAAPELRQQKDAFYHELLRLKLQEMPDDPTTWVQYGLEEYEECNHPEEALRCFEQALRLKPECATAWLFTGMIHCDSKRYKEALDALERAGSGDDGAALRERLKGDAFNHLGRLKEARTAYWRALKRDRRDWLVQSKLGYTEVTLGQKKTGIAKLRRAATELPSVFEVHDRLLQAYLVADRLPEAAEEAERFTGVAAHPALFLRAAGMRAQLKQWEKVETLSARGLQLFPQSAELHDLLMKAYIVAGRLPAAAAVAERLASVVAHPKSFLRAASIYAQLQQPDRAERLLLRGLESFPDSTELQQALAEARNNDKGTPAEQATTTAAS